MGPKFSVFLILILAVFLQSCKQPSTSSTLASTNAVAFTSPDAVSFVNASNMASFTVAGTCSVSGEDVVISGGASATAICTSGTWTANVNLTSAAQGYVKLSAKHEGATAERTFLKDTIAPTVSNVTATSANASYAAGATIGLRVTFTEKVRYTGGTPSLLLETGISDAVVNAQAVNGTTILFSYVVATGQVSSDLEYASTAALSSNGATISDDAGNSAVLTLPALGGAGSLSANKNLIVAAGTIPTVTGVTSSTANGTYGIGSAVSIQISFSESVTVTGTPQLTLETGATDAVVNYASGSGTSTLTFTYTIASGENSTDLDYASTAALILNGGTIKSTVANVNATRTLAAPGAANSLGANKALVIDTTGPTVTGVTSSTANSTYGIASAVSIQISFSDNVTITGTPQLTLETGATDAVVNYVSGSGTSTLTFTYTVASGENSTDLDYQSTTALALNGGTIKDAVANDATLTLVAPGAANSLGANKALVIDTTGPTVTGVTSSTANGTYGSASTVSIQISFSDNVTVTGTPQLTLETGGTDAVVNYASGTGTSTLTFTYTVASGENSTDLDYQSTTALALNGGTIKDAVANDATLTLVAPGAANSLGANKALVIDTTGPTVTGVTSSTASGTYAAGSTLAIQVVFNNTVTVTGTPQLTLETGATDAVLNYTSGSGTSTLVFNYTVGAGHNSTDLDYQSTTALALNGGTIKDALANNATLTLAAPNAANSLAANKNLVIDTAGPFVTGVALNHIDGDGSYAVGEPIPIEVNFNENVTVTGTPQLTLETGATDAVVNYVSGSGTTTLAFTYTVAIGHTSANLDYINTTALALNGGTIKDAVANNATLTLAAPGAANSLGAYATITVLGSMLAVAPVYPSNGANWNDYVQHTGTGKDYQQPDAACNTASTGYYGQANGCIHGGEKRAVTLTGISSCTGLTMFDDLAVFEWTCDAASGTAIFYSSFKTGKGLKDLIAVTGGFSDNFVTLKINGTTSGTSSTDPWWVNTVTALPNNSGAMVVTDLNTAGTIYYLAANRDTGGYRITADKIAVVTLPGVTLSLFDSATKNCDKTTGDLGTAQRCIFLGPNRKFIWIEGHTLGPTNVADEHVLAYNWKFSRIHSTLLEKAGSSNDAALYFVNSSYNAVTEVDYAVLGNMLLLDNSTKNIFRHLRLVNGGQQPIGLANSSNYNKFFDVDIATTAQNSIHVGTSSSRNVFSRINISNGTRGIYFSSSSFNIASEILVSSVTTPISSTGSNYVGHATIGRTPSGDPAVNLLDVNNLVNSLHVTNSFTTGITTDLACTGCAVVNASLSGSNPIINNSNAPVDYQGFLIAPSGTSCLAVTNSNLDINCDRSGNPMIAFDNSTHVTGFLNAGDANMGGNSLAFAGISGLAGWLGFENKYRAWGSDHTGALGECTSGNCEVYEWRTTAAGKGKSIDGATDASLSYTTGGACMTGINGAATDTLTFDSMTFLMNAVEINFDQIGNDNTLCEAGESCIYAPNIGAYLGEGPLPTTYCTSTGASVNGAKVYMYPTLSY